MMRSEPAAASAISLGEPPSTVGGLEDELKTFIGVGAADYLTHFRTRSIAAAPDASSHRRLSRALSWHWPAFLVTIPWMFYRKMYSGGILLVTLPILLNYIRPGAIFIGSGLLIALLAGIYAKAWYLDHALNRIRRAHLRGLSGAEKRQYLRRAGGVSLPGAVFGLLIELVLITTAITGLYGGVSR